MNEHPEGHPVAATAIVVGLFAIALAFRVALPPALGLLPSRFDQATIPFATGGIARSPALMEATLFHSEQSVAAVGKTVTDALDAKAVATDASTPPLSLLAPLAPETPINAFAWSTVPTSYAITVAPSTTRASTPVQSGAVSGSLRKAGSAVGVALKKTAAELKSVF